MKLEEGGTLRTGIDILDRKLDGGIPEGTVATLAASPASQSELFLYEFAATRATVYLSTIRPEDAVVAALDDHGVDTDRVDVVRIDDDDPVGHARQVVADLPEGVNLVVDSTDVLEAEGGTQYRRFLTELTQRLTDATSVALLYCLCDDPIPPGRRDTVHVADLVLQLSTEVSGDSVDNRLTVPKFRNGRSIAEVLKLDLTSDVEVDLSRNIL